MKVIDQGDLGTVLITSRGMLKGIFTDGDVRRAVAAGVELGGAPVSSLMSPAPLTVSPEAQAAEALHLMEDKQITALAVVSPKGRVLGLVHLHDLLGRGAVSLNGLLPPPRE